MKYSYVLSSPFKFSKVCTAYAGDEIMVNLGFWLKERFPPINVFSSYLLLALVIAVFHHDIFSIRAWSPFNWLIGIALTCQFLLLRVLDEHKDYQADLIVHPERVLQKGLVNLKQLHFLGVIAFFITLATTAMVGQNQPEVYFTWAAMMVWTFLMAKEFFCSLWLKQKLILYSLSHMLVLPLMILWIFSLLKLQIGDSTDLLSFTLGLVFVNGMIYEVLRKMKGPDETHNLEDNFPKHYGLKNSIILALFFLSFSITLFFNIATQHVNVKTLWLIPTLVSAILTVASILKFYKQPNIKNRKANEGAGALMVLIMYLTLILAKI